ncbi:MAG: sodium:calcium antiporter [Candidatus Saccharibacteria bacterium]
MGILTHSLLFILSLGVIWFFAGILIDAIDRVAKRFNKSGFTVAFFILGFLTSISEISVAVNASLENQPQISVGNLIGASLVILLLIVPFLAVSGNGISLRNTLSRRNLALALGIVLLPAFFVLDGSVDATEGVIILLVYGTLIYSLRKKESVIKTIERVDESIVRKKHTTFKDAMKILAGAAFIFTAGHLLVREAAFFSDLLGVPSSLIGLLLLSIGTNVPEAVIAIRSIYKKRKDIAFGDYLGSAVANTPIFGMLAIFNGKFDVEPSEFLISFFLMLLGLIMFYLFAGSKHNISRREGWVLLLVYAAFLIVQAATLLRLAEK